MSLSHITDLLENGSCKHEDATSMACMSGDLTGLKYLHSCKYPLSPKSFYMAVKHNHMNCVEYLIEHKCPFESNVYEAAIEYIQIFTRLKKLYDETPHVSLDLLPNMYAQSLLLLIIKKNYIDILKLYDNDNDFIFTTETINRIEERERKNKENGTEYETLCSTYYDDIEGFTLLESILEYKRSDILNWCYKSDNYLCYQICNSFPISDDETNINYYSEEQLEFFINWFQNRARKEGDSMRLCSYSEILLSDTRFDSPLNICDIYYRCKIPIDNDILKVFDSDKIAFSHCVWSPLGRTDIYDYDKVVPIIEWLVAHIIDINISIIIRWALNSKYHPWIAPVCRTNHPMINDIVLYCIKFNNVHLLTYLHDTGIKLPENICGEASSRDSVNVLNWGISHNYKFDYNANAKIAMNCGYLDILKVCYALNYKVTVDDIINQVDRNNKNMFIWMISVVDNLDKLALHVVERDNVEYLKILLLNRKPFLKISGMSYAISTYSLICDKIKNHIARYNAKKVCSYLLTYDWWKKHIREPDNMLYYNTFHYTAIEYGNIEVLKLVGLYPPQCFKLRYYNDLINHALHHKKYDIVEWINEIKLKK